MTDQEKQWGKDARNLKRMTKTAVEKLPVVFPSYVAKVMVRTMSGTKVVCDPNVDVAATDGKSIAIGRGFADYSPHQRAYILAHEILHVYLNHAKAGNQMARAVKGFDHEKWNIAIDAVVNDILDKHATTNAAKPDNRITSSLVVKSFQLTSKFGAGTAAEEIYEAIKDAKQEDSLPEPDFSQAQPDPAEDSTDEKPDDSEAGKDERDKSQSESESGGEAKEEQGEQDPKSESEKESGDGESESESEKESNCDKSQSKSGNESGADGELEQVVLHDPKDDQSVEESLGADPDEDGATMGQSGKMFEASCTSAKAFDGSRAVAEELILRYVGSRVKERRSMRRMNKRLRAAGFCLPANCGDGDPDSVAIGFDVSTSMSFDTLRALICLLNNLRKRVQSLKFEVFAWNSGICRLDGRVVELKSRDNSGRILRDGIRASHVRGLNELVVSGKRADACKKLFASKLPEAKDVTMSRVKAIQCIDRKQAKIWGGTCPDTALLFAALKCKSKTLVLVTDGDFAGGSEIYSYGRQFCEKQGLALIVVVVPSGDGLKLLGSDKAGLNKDQLLYHSAWNSMLTGNVSRLRDAGIPAILMTPKVD